MMANGSYPFVMYSGLLEPSHYQKIGNALWLFLWCVSATTKDIEKDGVLWGIVHGNKPIKRGELALQFKVSERTIQRWLDALEQHGYIKTTRAPYGLVLTVRNSKKYVAASARSNGMASRREYDSDRSLAGNGTKLSIPQDNIVRCNKDITKDLAEAVEDIERYFIGHRGKGVAISPHDYAEIRRLVSAGVPTVLIKACIDRAFHVFRPRHERDEIRSFRFVVPLIYDEWSKKNAAHAPERPSSAAIVGAAGRQGKYKSRQQRELDELCKIRKEEQRREQAASHRSV